MTELQKLTKHSQKTLGVYTGEKYLRKNSGVKEGGGRLLEGGIFLGAYGSEMQGTMGYAWVSGCGVHKL